MMVSNIMGDCKNEVWWNFQLEAVVAAFNMLFMLCRGLIFGTLGDHVLEFTKLEHF